MEPVDRKEFARELFDRMRIEQAHDGIRLVTLDGVVVGRLGWDDEAKRWGLQIKADWRPNVSELEAPDAEYAETWACNEVADWYAMERRAYAEEKPWGEEKPPGMK